MKNANRRLQFFNAGMQMLNKLTLTRLQASRENKRLRQEKQARNRQQWHMAGSGTRECARRVRQMANGMDCGQGNFR